MTDRAIATAGNVSATAHLLPTGSLKPYEGKYILGSPAVKCYRRAMARRSRTMNRLDRWRGRAGECPPFIRSMMRIESLFF